MSVARSFPQFSFLYVDIGKKQISFCWLVRCALMFAMRMAAALALVAVANAASFAGHSAFTGCVNNPPGCTTLYAPHCGLA